MSHVPTEVVSALKVLSDFAKTTDPATLTAIISIAMASAGDMPFQPTGLGPRKVEGRSDRNKIAWCVTLMYDEVCRIYNHFSNDRSLEHRRFHEIIGSVLRKSKDAYTLADTGGELSEVLARAAAALYDLDTLVKFMREHQAHFGAWAVTTAANAFEATERVISHYHRTYRSS